VGILREREIVDPTQDFSYQGNIIALKGEWRESVLPKFATHALKGKKGQRYSSQFLRVDADKNFLIQGVKGSRNSKSKWRVGTNPEGSGGKKRISGCLFWSWTL